MAGYHKESAYSVGDLGLIPGLGRSPGEGKGYLFQYSGLENSMGCVVHRVVKSQTRLSNFHVTSRDSAGNGRNHSTWQQPTSTAGPGRGLHMHYLL